MVLKTEYLGSIEYTKDEIITFEKGLFGFEKYKKYLLIEHPEPQLPYMWLQCIEDQTLYFIVTNPFYFVESYDFELPDSVVKRLEIREIDEVLPLTLVVIPDKVDETTINLQSPIIVNKKNKTAEQIILDEKFPLKYKLFKEGVD